MGAQIETQGAQPSAKLTSMVRTEHVRKSGAPWSSPGIPELGEERQADLCESAASLVYKASPGKPKLYIEILF